MRILTNDERGNATCHFCGKSQSVRYAVTALIDGKRAEVKCCNRCVLAHMGSSNMANVNDVKMD